MIYIKNYFEIPDEWYFIIEDLNHIPLGTLRIYDVVDDHYTSGSWLMKDGSTLAQAVEGVILLKDFAFNELGFDKDIFDVRKQNKKVLNFHKMCGAKIISEDQENYYFELTRETFNKKIPFSSLGEFSLVVLIRKGFLERGKFLLPFFVR